MVISAAAAGQTAASASVSITGSQAGTGVSVVATGETSARAASQTSTCTAVRAMVSWENVLDCSGKLLVVRSWCTIILLVSVGLASADNATSILELVESFHWQSRHTVVLS